jgi:hypothetical protein
MRARATEWLLAHIDSSGQPAWADEHSGYSRLPWTLAHVGERDAASAVLAFIERHTLTDDGDLQEGPPRDIWVRAGATYPLSMIAHGAWLLDRFDTASAVMQTLRPMQDPVTGGAYWERPEARANGWQLMFPTAQLGFTAVTTGSLDMADAAFAWFERLMSAQPGLPNRLYAGWGPDGLVTKPPAESAFSLVVEFDKPKQAFYNPGISAGFLARYAMATGNETARRLAADLLALHEGATAAQYHHWESTGICKLAFGAAAMLELSPDDKLVHTVLRMTQWYADSQLEDGSWLQRTGSRPEPLPAHVLEKTAEHALWVSMMLASLGGYESAVGLGLGG